MRIDLHTHSDRSDGTDSPAALVRRAAGRGVDVLGVTDHDTTPGWAEAAEEAASAGVRLVRGIEISTRYAGSGVHLLAYLPDADHPGLVAELDRILEGRTDRLPAVLARLRSCGIDVDADDVRRVAGEAAALGRPHVADALVERGVVARPRRGLRALPRPGRTGVRRPLRRRPGRHDRPRRRGGRGHR